MIDNDTIINPELFRRQFIKDFKNIKDDVNEYLIFGDDDTGKFYQQIKDLLIEKNNLIL